MGMAQTKRTMRNTPPPRAAWLAFPFVALGLVWMAYAHAHGMHHAAAVTPGMYAPPVMYHSPLAGGAVHVPHVRVPHVRAPYMLRRPLRGVFHPFRFVLWHM